MRESSPASPPPRSSASASPRARPVTRVLALVAATAVVGLAVVVPTELALAAPTGVTGAVLAPVAATPADVATTLSQPCGTGLVTAGGTPCGGAATVRYGQGVQQRLVSYQAAGRTFTVLPSDDAAVTAEVLRVDNAVASGDRENIWIANSPAGSPFTGVSGDPTGRTMADVLSSPFVTEGSDNLFGNTGGITTNDVERFSVLRESPLTASDPANVAVSIVERGGNDAFKLAAVTAVDADGAPVAWGPIVSVPRSAWGPILTGVTSTVQQQLPGTAGYRPLDYTAAQTIAGVSVSLTDLGVLPGQPLFGVSLVGNDETSMSGPFTTTTNETTDGGLDLVSAVFATAVQPAATPTAVTGTQGARQLLPLVVAPGDPLVPIDASATRLEAPAGATVDAGGTVVVVPGEGRYELDRAAGVVVFTPEPGFTGTATPLPYVVTDAAGATAASTLSPSVTEVARPDVSTGEQGVEQRIDVTANDGGAVPVDPGTLRLVDAADLDATAVVVPDEGAWSVDGDVLVFAPEPAFVGTATPVGYRVDTVAGAGSGSGVGAGAGVGEGAGVGAGATAG
jgi:CshA-type fibril repeat protein